MSTTTLGAVAEIAELRRINKIMLNELEEILSWAEVEKAPLRELEMKSIRKVIEKARRG